MKFWLRLIGSCCGIMLSLSVYSAEIDPYTGTDRFIWSGAKYINQVVNRRLQRVADNLTDEEVLCSNHHQSDAAEDFYGVFVSSFIENVPHTFWGNLYVGHFIAEQFHIESPEKIKINLPLEESIYQDMDVIDGPSLVAKGTLGITKLNGSFDMFGANYIGWDKVGHFFVEGRSYYQLAYLDQDEIDIDSAVAWGVSTEEGKFGYLTTGVYSFADTATNFEGMRFWNQLLMLNPDPIDPDDSWHNRAYFTCSLKLNEEGDPVGVWKQSKTFDIDQYANAAMDERINCNSYRNTGIRDKVKARIAQATDEYYWRGEAQCPVYPSRCGDLIGRYGKWNATIISPECQAEFN